MVVGKRRLDREKSQERDEGSPGNEQYRGVLRGREN